MDMPPNAVIMRDCIGSKVNGQYILRGVIDVKSLKNLRVGSYQREPLPVEKPEEWAVSYETGLVEDVVLGMRGDRIALEDEFPELGPDGAALLDPTYLIDGQQRREAAYFLLASDEYDVVPYLGARVLFDTTEESERVLFDNQRKRRRISPNITMRNLIPRSPVLKGLYLLTLAEGAEDEFPEVFPDLAMPIMEDQFLLAGRVGWRQRLAERDLLSVVSLAKVLGELHNHLGTTRSQEPEALVAGFQKAINPEKGRITHDQMLANLVNFFDFVEKLWKIGEVRERKLAGVCRLPFLLALARLFSEHQDFWREKGVELFVRTRDEDKLSLKVNPQDPFVMTLTAVTRLFEYLKEQVNQRRDTGALKPWK